MAWNVAPESYTSIQRIHLYTDKDIAMQFPKANSFSSSIVKDKIMGPNPLKLCEEMLEEAAGEQCPAIPQGSVVLDLGSGTGITSALSSMRSTFGATLARTCGSSRAWGFRRTASSL